MFDVHPLCGVAGIAGNVELVTVSILSGGGKCVSWGRRRGGGFCGTLKEIHVNITSTSRLSVQPSTHVLIYMSEYVKLVALEAGRERLLRPADLEYFRGDQIALPHT
jgi:hypothetical protein